MNIAFLGVGFQPLWALEDIPIMPKGRYQIMRNYMAKVGRLGRQMMFRSNFGICRFESSGDAITAIGEVYTEAIDPDTQLPVMAPYMVHRAPLGPLTEDPPADLRRFVIERKPIPEPTP